ncbi:cell division protein FtsA [bacterium]|nr:cell division protein FtsA [bacterium]MBU0900120.1 cell division protein FtsA [bacterium]MBU1153482.1 cell division protein FtsA [bacterium]MBU2599028.1 cell division protein FtsA [bacterium]
MPKGDPIVGLDIGTSKVCAVIGEEGEDGQIEIVGVGSTASTGLRKGVVVNIDATVRAIETAVAEAELMAGVDISSCYVGIGGSHIKGLNSHGVIAISRSREVAQTDVNRVLDAAKAVAIPLDREVIHILPQQYIIDGQDGINDPVGMSGVRLEVETHIVTGAVTSVQNVVKSVNRAGLSIEDVILIPLASSAAILSEDEKELGVVLVDVGGGTTSVAVFVEGSIWHTEILSIGGFNVTKDISVGLRTPITEAEKLKIEYGCALSSMVSSGEEVEVMSVGGRKKHFIPREILAKIIEARLEEIFNLVNREIKAVGYENSITTGIVLTGGEAMLEGIPELAERIFDCPVRIGTPKNIGGLVDIVSKPVYTTAVGLVSYGMKSRLVTRGFKAVGENVFKSLSAKARNWFSEFF